jgi:hypothetical protein
MAYHSLYSDICELSPWRKKNHTIHLHNTASVHPAALADHLIHTTVFNAAHKLLFKSPLLQGRIDWVIGQPVYVKFHWRLCVRACVRVHAHVHVWTCVHEVSPTWNIITQKFSTGNITKQTSAHVLKLISSTSHPYFPKIYLNIILPFPSQSSNWPFSIFQTIFLYNLKAARCRCASIILHNKKCDKP